MSTHLMKNRFGSINFMSGIVFVHCEFFDVWVRVGEETKVLATFGGADPVIIRRSECVEEWSMYSGC